MFDRHEEFRGDARALRAIRNPVYHNLLDMSKDFNKTFNTMRKLVERWGSAEAVDEVEATRKKCRRYIPGQ